MTLGLNSMAEAIARGEISAQASVAAALSRIDVIDGQLGAFLLVDGQAALAIAEERDRERAAGRLRGKLHGVPFAYKDIFRRDGYRATAGTVPPDDVARETATVLAELIDAGAVPIGALNMDELAAGGTGINEHYRRCANPYALDHIAGGSSSGSAASVAAGLVPASLGSDAGGSIRLPAAFCGVVGLKPSYGRISRHATLARSWSMDSTGPLARDAADCALLLSVVAGRDPRDPTTADVPVPDYVAALTKHQDLRGLKIGLALDGPYADIDDEIRRAIAKACDTLRDLGATLVPVEIPDVGLLNDLQQVLVKCEAATLHGKRLRRDPEGIGFSARSVIQEGLLIPATRYIEALSLRGPLLEAHVAALYRGAAEIVLAPVIPGPAPSAAAMATGDSGTVERLFTRTARFTRAANYLGTPAISVPCGLSQTGLPMAFQFMGPPFAEATLLAAANAYLRATGPLPVPKLTS
ncbi:amidase [Halotia wernerae UHCC 0503]|nr:amidase [Halotia wernerae UHCC 0503]